MCILCNNKKKKLNYIHLHSCNRIKKIKSKIQDTIYFNCNYTYLQNINNLDHYNLVYLYCQHSKLYNLKYNLYNLIDLNISFTNIIELPNSLYNLKYLNIQNTLITSLPDNLNNLEILEADNSKLIYLPNNLYNIKKLFIRYTNIKNILDYNKLEYLDCSYTQIDQLSDKLIKLKSINCENTLIKTLSDKYINLEYLNCQNTLINNISDKYILLKELYIFNTNINIISYKYKLLRKIYSNNIFLHDKLKIKQYININFLIYHFKTKFKFIRKYKYITIENIYKYIDLILDNYLNPNSLSLQYKVQNFDKPVKQLLYINSKNQFKIFNLI